MGHHLRRDAPLHLTLGFLLGESFEQLLRGDLDDLPEQAFLNVGGADAARAKADELRKSAGE